MSSNTKNSKSEVSNSSSSKPKVDANGKKLKKKVNRDVASVLNKNDLSRRSLLGMNPYLQTLMDPFNVGGVRIPDMEVTPSGTFQVVDRRTLTVNATGLCALAYGFYSVASSSAQGGSLVPVVLSGSGSQSCCVGMTNSANTCSLTDVFNGASPIFLSGWQSGSDTVPSYYTKARLVSAGLVVQYLGAPLNAKGKASFCFAPRNSMRTISSSGLSVARILSVPGARIVPVNTLASPILLYQPQDGVSLEYVDLTSTSPCTTGSQWDIDANLRAAVGGELILAFDGCTVGDTISCTFVANYEGIPRTNALNIISVSSSPSHPISLNHAFNSIQDIPTAHAATPIEASNSTGSKSLNIDPVSTMVPHPYSQTPEPVVSGTSTTENKQQKDSPTGMFDSILSGITGILPKIPEILETASPLLEGLLAFL